MSTSTNTNAFWDRPEGKTAKWIIRTPFALVAIAALIFHEKTLELMWAALELTWTFGLIVATAVAFIAIYLVWASAWRKTLTDQIAMSMGRAVYGMFVPLDPVGILRNVVKKMKMKKQTIATSIQKVAGGLRALQEKERLKEAEAKEALARAAVAQKNGLTDQYQAETEKVGRRIKALENIRAMIARMQEMHNALIRIDGRVDYYITTSQDELDDLASNNNDATIMLEATSAARAALGEDVNEEELKRMAVDHIRERYNGALGEVDNLLRMTESTQSAMDMDKMVFQAAGAASLESLQAQLAATEQPKALAAPRVGNYISQSTTANADALWAKRLNSRN